MTVETEFDAIETAPLLALRERCHAGVAKSAERLLIPGAVTGEGRAGMIISIGMVERMDASLLKRGVKVPAPFWLE